MSKQKLASKAILQYLDSSGRVRTERLRETICGPPPKGKDICSPKMFYRYLADLVKSKRVRKFEIRRNEISYSTPDWVEYQNEISRDVTNHACVIQKHLKQLQSAPEIKKQPDLDYIIDIFHGVFMEIMYMHNWATLAKLRNPKEEHLAVGGILTGTVPDLLKLFSKAIGKYGQHSNEIWEDLVEEQDAVAEYSHVIGRESRPPEVVAEAVKQAQQSPRKRVKTAISRPKKS